MRNHSSGLEKTLIRNLVLGLFMIINFPNEPCSGTNGLNGTCMANRYEKPA